MVLHWRIAWCDQKNCGDRFLLYSGVDVILSTISLCKKACRDQGVWRKVTNNKRIVFLSEQRLEWLSSYDGGFSLPYLQLLTRPSVVRVSSAQGLQFISTRSGWRDTQRYLRSLELVVYSSSEASSSSGRVGFFLHPVSKGEGLPPKNLKLFKHLAN